MDFESEGPKELTNTHVVNLMAVSGMDICVRRRLIATCSTDMMIRVWSYCRLLCDLTYVCHEQPTSIAISPWGYELVVTLATSSLFVIGVMANRLEPRREITLQGCGPMQYSPSGHLIAVLSGRDIVVYSCFTWEVVATLIGHIGKVTSVAWSNNSVHLASAGMDGAVYRWSTDDFKRHEECVTKGSQYSGVVYDPDRTFLYGCGPSLPLRIISTSNKPSPEILRTFPNDVLIGVYEDGVDGGSANRYRGSILCELNEQPRYSQLAGFFHKNLILAVTAETQELHAYSYPFSTNKTAPAMKFPAQSGRIAALCVDDTHGIVFARSEKGTIFMCTLEESQGPVSIMEKFRDRDDESEIENLLVISRNELRDVEEEVQNLKSSLQNEQDESRYRQHRIRQDWAVKIKDKEKEYSQKERRMTNELSRLKDKVDVAEKNLEHTTQTLLESQSQAIGTLYEHFEGKFTTEAARAEHWRTQAETVKENCVKEIEYKEKTYSVEVSGLRDNIVTIQTQSQSKMQKLQETCDREVRKFKTYMEEDMMINDEELVAGFVRMKQAMHNQQKHIDEARAQMLLEKKASTSYQLQISELTDLCMTQEASIRSLESDKSRLENFAIEFDYKKKILDKIVEEADEHRKALLHATKERETLAVLQHSRIQQLVEREKPLLSEMNQMKMKMQDMQTREALDAKHRQTQDEATRLLRERVQDLEQRVFKLLDQLRHREEYLDAFKEALCVIVQDHDPGEWPPLTRGLFLAYVKDSERAAVAEGLESRSQIMKQRQVLEDFVVVLKNTIDRTKDRCKEEIQHFVKENLNLLRDFCEANRNVRRMAFMVQKLQQQVAYFKGIVSMQKRSLARARAQGGTPPPEKQRRSVTALEPRRTSASFISSSIQRKMRMSREATALRLPSARPPTPVSEIVKPYSRFSIVHGDQDRTKQMSSAQIEKRMSRPWATDDDAQTKGSKVLQIEELLKQLQDTKSELEKKKAEISSLQRSLVKATAAGGSRPGSSLVNSKKKGAIVKGLPSLKKA